MEKGRKLKIETRKSFDNDFKKLPDEIKKVAIEQLKLLYEHPFPQKLRFKKYSGSKKPSIYAIHITSNHSYKASMEMKDGIISLRRIGTHKEIDRNP